MSNVVNDPGGCGDRMSTEDLVKNLIRRVGPITFGLTDPPKESAQEPPTKFRTTMRGERPAVGEGDLDMDGPSSEDDRTDRRRRK